MINSIIIILLPIIFFSYIKISKSNFYKNLVQIRSGEICWNCLSKNDEYYKPIFTHSEFSSLKKKMHICESCSRDRNICKLLNKFKYYLFNFNEFSLSKNTEYFLVILLISSSIVCVLSIICNLGNLYNYSNFILYIYYAINFYKLKLIETKRPL